MGVNLPHIDNRVYLFLQHGEFLTLAVIVVYIAFSSNSLYLMEKFKSTLSATFSVQLFGQVETFVGWSINVTDSFIKIGQRNYCR